MIDTLSEQNWLEPKWFQLISPIHPFLQPPHFQKPNPYTLLQIQRFGETSDGFNGIRCLPSPSRILALVVKSASKSGCGQLLLRPNQLWPKPSLAKPSLAKTNFGQNQLWPEPSLVITKFGQYQVWPHHLWPCLSETKFGLAKLTRIGVCFYCVFFFFSLLLFVFIDTSFFFFPGRRLPGHPPPGRPPPGLHDNPRTPNVNISRPRRFKHHQNSTRRPQEREERKKNMWQDSEKKREFLGTPPFGAPPFGAPSFGAPSFGAPPFLTFSLWGSRPRPPPTRTGPPPDLKN